MVRVSNKSLCSCSHQMLLLGPLCPVEEITPSSLGVQGATPHILEQLLPQPWDLWTPSRVRAEPHLYPISPSGTPPGLCWKHHGPDPGVQAPGLSAPQSW